MRIYAVIVSAIVSLVCLFTLQSGISLAGVAGSKHDLSNGASAAAFKYETEQICVFCHTPHKANTNFKTKAVYNTAGGGAYDTSSGTPLLLWNRALANAGASAWTLYTGTMGSRAPHSVGVYSLMCMSCHDGIMALNQLTTDPRDATSPIPPTSGSNDQIGDLYPGSACDPANPAKPCINIGERFPGGSDNMYLNNDHPVTIDYNVSQAAEPEGLKTLANVKLDTPQIKFFPDPYGSSQTDLRFVECPSCHNPHEYGDDFEKTEPFLVMSRRYSALCLACHLK